MLDYPKLLPFACSESLFKDGYDSDGAIGPFFDAVNKEGTLAVDEEEVGTVENDILQRDNVDIVSEPRQSVLPPALSLTVSERSLRKYTH